jgi:hypothetical protein
MYSPEEAWPNDGGPVGTLYLVKANAVEGVLSERLDPSSVAPGGILGE